LVTTLERVFREEWGRVLSTLIGLLGDFDLAEEAAQEAFNIAAERWPGDGVPTNPRAWLTRTARNRAIDRIRRDRTLATKLDRIATDHRVQAPMATTAFPDERLDAVLTVVYLIFNEGYGGRDELAAEALWLGRALTELLPNDPETRGLSAMILLHDSRRDARFRDGELILLAEQDRTRWNAQQIAEGRAELDRARALGGRGPYVLQAAIASLHAETPTDWVQIAALYGELAHLTGSPVVELNRAIAIAETDGPEAGLRIVDRLGLDDFRYLHSTRADLLRRLGRTEEAREAYRDALDLTENGAERRFIERRLTELTAAPGDSTVG